MLEEINLTPIFYTVDRSLADNQIAQVLHALRITPISAAVVTEDRDSEFAARFNEEVRKVLSLPAAFEFARASDGPVLIVTGDSGFNAHYADHTEAIEIPLKA